MKEYDNIAIPRGRFILACWQTASVLEFRKIEIKELGAP
jgi:hypothetical protein